MAHPAPVERRRAAPAAPPARRALGRLPQVPLEPPGLAAPIDALELERADLGHVGAEPDGHDLSRRAAVGGQRRLDRRPLLELGLVLDRVAGPVLAAIRGGEQPELDRLADDEPHLLARQVSGGALLHAHRREAQRADGRRKPGDGGHRSLDADVVRARGPTPDADPVTRADAAVGRRASRDGEVRIRRGQDPRRRRALRREPAADDLEQPPDERLRLHHSAIEEDGGGMEERLARERDGRARAGEPGAVAGEERGEVAGDRGIGGVREPERREAGAPRRDRAIRDLRAREEAVHEHTHELLARELGGERAPDERRASPGDRHRRGRERRIAEERLLRLRARHGSSARSCQRSSLRPSRASFSESACARARSMLSPPRRMWSPTATRSRPEIAAPVHHRDEAEVGRATADVARRGRGRPGAPPCASDRPSPRPTRRAPPAAPRGAPRRRAPPARAASTVSSRATASNDAGTVSVTRCAASARAGSPCANAWSHASRRCAR